MAKLLSGTRIYGNLTVDTYMVASGNIVAAATTTSTSTTTGALVVKGGAGVAGNVVADKFYTTNGLYWAGNGVAFSSGGGGTGITYTASATAPVSPSIGDQWYYTTSDVLLEYVNDGTTSYWVDIQSPTVPQGTIVSDLVLANVTINSFYNAAAVRAVLGYNYIDTSTGNITVSSNIVPASDDVYTLGSSTRAFREMWIRDTAMIGSNTQSNAIISTGNIWIAGNIIPGLSTGIANIGTPSQSWNTIFAKATSAQYADLAENYKADAEYSAGTVVIIGGTQEITVTNIDHDSRVAGVISTNPAYLMNSAESGLPVALVGRVPCRVRGPITKGDLLVTSNSNGIAQRLETSKYVPGCVIGKSLATIAGGSIETIEIIVGRF